MDHHPIPQKESTFFKRPTFYPFAIMKMDIRIPELPFLLILDFNHCLRSKYIILETVGGI